MNIDIAKSEPARNGKLAQAKANVMSEVKRLEKLHENKHAGYAFASVDDFKDQMRPLLAKNGIDVHVSEDSYDLIATKNKDGKESQAAKIRFKFVLNHISGESSEPTFFTVCLPYTGAQTSGAAQSYAIKEGVYKGLFQASSGDISEEADLQDQGKSMTVQRLSKAEAKPLFEALSKEMNAVATETRDDMALASWWRENIEQLRMLPADWFLTIKSDCADLGKGLKALEVIDRQTQKADT